jgi:cytosine/adenosine deaminase-related metal-dependent hydrolase
VNPESPRPEHNMRLASGVIRLPDLKQPGVQIGLGLDGGTNDTSDMFNNMRAAQRIVFVNFSFHDGAITTGDTPHGKRLRGAVFSQSGVRESRGPCARSPYVQSDLRRRLHLL